MPNDRLLAGKLVVAACSELKAGDLRSRLQSLGADVLLFPAIRVRAVQDKPAAQETVAALQQYNWLIFTSAHAVAYFASLLHRSGTSLPEPVQVCAIGPATAEQARSAGLRVDLVPERYVAEAVVEALSHIRPPAGQRILFPCARQAREVIPIALRESGARVDVLPLYETVAGTVPESTLQCVREGNAHLLVFTSSSTVSNFVSILGEQDGRNTLARTTVAALGPMTARTAEFFGKVPEIRPGENTIPSLVLAIADYWSARGGA